jgi:uncharacterized membrane protein YciS (DUF1049 family)
MTTKYIKIAAYVIEAAIISVLVILAIAVGAKNKQLKQCRQQIAEQTVVIDSLQKEVKALGALDAITINATFNVNNKNIFSVNTTQANQVMKTYATLTRQEILDSLYKN